jgi:hypothetical protein
MPKTMLTHRASVSILPNGQEVVRPLCSVAARTKDARGACTRTSGFITCEPCREIIERRLAAGRNEDGTPFDEGAADQ